VTRLKKAIEQDKRDIPETVDVAIYKNFDFSKTHEALVEAKNKIAEHSTAEDRLQQMRDQIGEIENEIEQKKQAILDLTERIQSLEAKRDDINKRGKALAAEMGHFEAPDVAALQAQIDGYQEAQELVLKIREIERRENEFEEQRAIHERFDELHKLLATNIPQAVLAKMDLPIDGIAVEGDNVQWKDVDLDKLSTKEQIEFSLQLARALSGKLKVICIDRFESLSAANRKQFIAEASKSDDDYQYFTTQVTEGPLKMESSGGAGEPPSKQGSGKSPKAKGADF
jgi:archaellum component FlaC